MHSSPNNFTTWLQWDSHEDKAKPWNVRGSALALCSPGIWKHSLWATSLHPFIGECSNSSATFNLESHVDDGKGHWTRGTCVPVHSFISVVQSCSTSCNPMDCSTPGFPWSITNSHSLLKLMSIGSVMTSNHLILCHHLLLLPSIFPSIRVFSSESVLHIGWPKYWHFGFSISPSNEYWGLISFRIDWFDLLAVQGTLKGRLQHHSSKESILQHSSFLIVPTLASTHNY